MLEGGHGFMGVVNHCRSHCGLANFRGLVYGRKYKAVIGQNRVFLYVPNMIQVTGSSKPITALYFPPYIKARNVAEQQCERQWLTSPRFSPQVLVCNSGFRDSASQFIRV